jgi:ACS family glucarate transporter-like MFS transporter
MPANGNVPDPALEPATRVRYGVLAYLGALSFILYIDRICIGQAAPVMQRDLGLSDSAMGVVFGAFTVAYGLFEVPTGRWGDRYGSRGVLTRIVLWWSAFTALTGCVWAFRLDSGIWLHVPGIDSRIPLFFDSFALLVLVRFLFGAGEAGAIPNTARVLARWFPAGARGPAQGVVTTAALLGGAVAPVVAAYLIKLIGWRLAFVTFGSLGVVWAIAFYGWFRDDPAEHPAVNEAERRLLAGGPAPNTAAAHAPIPWGQVLLRGNLWLLGGVISCSAFASYLYFSWYPKYLQAARDVPPVESGWLASLVLLGGAVGCTLGGWLSDAAVRRIGRRWGRKMLGSAGLGGACLSLVAGVHCDAAVASAFCTALASLCAGIQLAAWWGIVTEISGRHVGALFGLLNSMGVPGAVTSQLFFGRFADVMAERGYTGRDQWDPAFLVCAGVLLTGAVGWLCVDATRPLVEADA